MGGCHIKGHLRVVPCGATGGCLDMHIWDILWGMVRPIHYTLKALIVRDKNIVSNDVQVRDFEVDTITVNRELSWWVLWRDDVIKWKHFPRYWPFVRGIHRSPVNSPHKGQWRGALIFSLICAWTKLSKQWRRRWFETPSRSLWRHCNDRSRYQGQGQEITSHA